ncbi:hypothetical protein Gasu2_20960 [Galdieria sulphuraria]|uniref:Membrane transporter protein n=1 Tax=Galdieria sulphuraria TaxID=130081 RepID=M2X4H1_GALSU|nr:uncharacterized protein Gasu_15590 [Galdieria sulphuraria]EME31325.1 hypothetical protein Gasu_15590 [Galdieria sulphuraria]GJD07756.1 hypothetical protein Gasu2_20960 [Galdieria sulphuraria]|eukprot:XP_005707845.1 hypothetical protein Gasu_15590 [Galdieria sulphuraria]
MATAFLCQTCFCPSKEQFSILKKAKRKSVCCSSRVTVFPFGSKRRLYFGPSQLCKSSNTVTCKLLPNFFSNLLFGFSAGCIASLVGAGGGVVLTPLFVTFYGLTQKQAQGTSLVAVSFNSLVASFIYFLGGRVLLLPAFFLTLTAVICARVGAKVTSKLDNLFLRKCFGFLLIFLSLLLPLRQYLQVSLGRMPMPTQEKGGLLSIALYLFAGSIAGFLSGLLGIGGGIILVPFLAGALAIPQHFAQGTALLGMLLPSFSGSYVHWSQRNVNKNLLPGVVTGIIFGSFLGSNLALLFSERLLRIVCCIVFFLIGLRFISTSTQ